MYIFILRFSVFYRSMHQSKNRREGKGWRRPIKSELPMRRLAGAGLRKRIPLDVFPWPSEIYMNCLDQGNQEYKKKNDGRMGRG
jgi:hypothetical protein